jgi:acyl-CoA dehydrogenase
VSGYTIPWESEDVAIARESARRFFEQEFAPNVDGWVRQGIVDREAWNKAGAAGINCASIPEQYGGAGGSFAHEAVIIEELEKSGVGINFGHVVHSTINAHYILAYGTEEQKKRWLPRMATGEMVTAIAMTEPGTGSDLQGVRTTARKDGNQYVVDGAKTFITNGQHADMILVVAKTGDGKPSENISLVAVEAEGSDGFRRGRNLEKMGCKGSDTSELFFDEVRVPPENILGGEEGRGFVQLMQQLPQERLGIAVGAVAAIERSVALASEYVKERKAFGQRLIDFQNTRFVLAECKTEAHIARVFLDNCIMRHLDGQLDTATASMAKWWTTQKQNEIVDRCLQLFGGYGYMTEFPISRMYTDARVQKIYGGTNEIMKELISRTL